MPRETFWSLQECCKCPEKLFGVCRNAANASKNFLAFAGMLQTLKKDEAPGTRRVREPHHTACTRRIFCLGAVGA